VTDHLIFTSIFNYLILLTPFVAKDGLPNSERVNSDPGVYIGASEEILLSTHYFSHFSLPIVLDLCVTVKPLCFVKLGSLYETFIYT
jgi:hypothetical protein